MPTFILFFIGYFFFTLVLSKIAEKEQMEWDWIAWFLLLVPPLYFLYITRRFSLMLIITASAYWVSNLLILKWIPFNIALTIFVIPVLISFTFILHNLKEDQKLNFINFFPPFFWTFFLLWYLAFHQTTIEKEIKTEKERENKESIKKLQENKNKAFKKTSFSKEKKTSDFKLLNKNIFKSFDNLDYNLIDNRTHFWTN